MSQILLHYWSINIILLDFNCWCEVELPYYWYRRDVVSLDIDVQSLPSIDRFPNNSQNGRVKIHLSLYSGSVVSAVEEGGEKNGWKSRRKLLNWWILVRDTRNEKTSLIRVEFWTSACRIKMRAFQSTPRASFGKQRASYLDEFR